MVEVLHGAARGRCWLLSLLGIHQIYVLLTCWQGTVSVVLETKQDDQILERASGRRKPTLAMFPQFAIIWMILDQVTAGDVMDVGLLRRFRKMEWPSSFFGVERPPDLVLGRHECGTIRAQLSVHILIEIIQHDGVPVHVRNVVIDLVTVHPSSEGGAIGLLELDGVGIGHHGECWSCHPRGGNGSSRPPKQCALGDVESHRCSLFLISASTC
mmetsp:Transcript_22792/g.63589  ORF Transcript_22792/g.63589 Transcript_22792/m.63589 type:complete len:213 (-) Transcript_22792:78-716(-)